MKTFSIYFVFVDLCLFSNEYLKKLFDYLKKTKSINEVGIA